MAINRAERARRKQAYLAKKAARDDEVTAYAKNKPERSRSRRVQAEVMRVVRASSNINSQSQGEPKIAPSVWMNNLAAAQTIKLIKRQRESYLGGGGGKPPGPNPLDGYKNLTKRFARTKTGKVLIYGGSVGAGAAGGAVADDVADYLWDKASDTMGNINGPLTQRLNPRIFSAGVGVYFRNILIGLMTNEDYDHLWASAATHIRKKLRAL